MKRSTYLLGALLLVGLAGLGCNKAGKLGEHSKESKPPAGPVEFKLLWPLGERVEQDMDLKMKMDINVPGQPATMHQDMSMGQNYGLTVLQANPDGSHEIELDFLSTRMTMKMEGGKAGAKPMEYDSSKKSDKPGPFDMLGKIVGAKIQYFLDASNEVERVEGVSQLMDRFTSTPNSQGAGFARGMFNDDYFKQLMKVNLLLPGKPVQPGDSWPVQWDSSAGPMGAMSMNFDCTFERWEMHGQRNCARLEFQGTVQSKPGEKSPVPMQIQDGSCTGIAWFDPELGLTIDTTMNENFTMIMQIPQPRQGKPKDAPATQSLTNQMQMVVDVKLVSVK